MTHKFTKAELKSIKKLASAYASLTQAYQENDYSGICTWSTILLQAQEETGVEMYGPETVRVLLHDAKRRLNDVEIVQKSAGEVVADFVREHSAYV